MFSSAIRYGLVSGDPDKEGKIYFGSVYANNAKYPSILSLGKNADGIHVNVYGD